MSGNASSGKLLPGTAYEAIERECAKYPPAQRRSGIMAALRIAQSHNEGWLPSELIEHVAEVIGIPAICAYEVATFLQHVFPQAAGEKQNLYLHKYLLRVARRR